MRVAATAGAGKRHVPEQRMAIRDFGTHTLASFLSFFHFCLHLCLISYVRLHMCVCVRKGRSPFSRLLEGMFIRLEVGIRQRRDWFLTSLAYVTSTNVSFI